jgi:hypothetical protein
MSLMPAKMSIADVKPIRSQLLPGICLASMARGVKPD